MLPIIVEICIQFSEMLETRKKNVFLRIKRCDLSLSAPFSATLFKGKMQPCVPTVNLLPQSSRWEGS